MQDHTTLQVQLQQSCWDVPAAESSVEDLTFKLEPLTKTSNHPNTNTLNLQLYATTTSTATIPPTMANQQQTPFPFLNLPAELRNQVYEDVINSDRNAGDGNSVATADNLALIASNQQIRAEFSSMLWPDAHLLINRPIIPGQLPAKAYKMPREILRQSASFQMYLKLDGLHFSTHRDKIRVYLICHPSKGTYRLWAPAFARRTSSWYPDEIAKYHAWKTIRAVEAWLEDRFSGMAMYPEAKVPGATIYPADFPHVISCHRRQGLKIVQNHYGPSQLPLRQKLLVCGLAEGHILYLRAQKIWMPIRAKLKDTTADNLENLATVLGSMALLRIVVLMIPRMQFFSFASLIGIPSIIRAALERLPSTTNDWVLTRLNWVWPTLFLVNAAVFVFSYGSWSLFWTILGFTISILLALS
ncbi:uncharacterized protein MYCFIDRAFT_84692 [Pseudocercospora fijiensis CIRAD86]|uniref:Uncharacterized protein n=1 Tax=Pseudocercospora fijiensis (strain CIRAD86) TaxID=383855 RepID=M3AT76_PSEFD|nr:uncharacterized protein MYCFIDRAFT_84692 [Pseudocercospora fijiensis CIRAD86]EME80682.1 hypothetical protein MYCFIDRAFT_84692 [Pseudocercospora fijiensis CIRAD86]